MRKTIALITHFVLYFTNVIVGYVSIVGASSLFSLLSNSWTYYETMGTLAQTCFAFALILGYFVCHLSDFAFLCGSFDSVFGRFASLCGFVFTIFHFKTLKNIFFFFFNIYCICKVDKVCLFLVSYQIIFENLKNIRISQES